MDNSLQEIIDLKGHQNCCIGSKVMALLLNGLILPTGGVASGRVFPAGFNKYYLLVVFEAMFKLDGVAPLIADPSLLKLHQ